MTDDTRRIPWLVGRITKDGIRVLVVAHDPPPDDPIGRAIERQRRHAEERAAARLMMAALMHPDVDQ